ncbi:hypothetical protein WDZ17_05690 [Pseudokineococcus basanitobsidens]|uniref:Uncharacterized protein n=1 Tax=Pseudokineococcus basanitobsidens TaxID=1926649 RepID=A0ABU8RI90_9ACTN
MLAARERPPGPAGPAGPVASSSSSAGVTIAVPALARALVRNLVRGLAGACVRVPVRVVAVGQGRPVVESHTHHPVHPATDVEQVFD